MHTLGHITSYVSRCTRQLRRLALPSGYDAEVGGYVHDTATSQFFPPSHAHYPTGTWTDTAGAVTGTIMKRKTAADNTCLLTIPVTPPQNSAASKGAYVKSVDVWWKNGTADLDALAAAINLATLPASGDAFGAVSAQAFTYDSGHDAAAERITQDEHKMTLTLDTPIWLDDDHLLLVEVTVNAAATSVFDYYGARANYTLRL